MWDNPGTHFSNSGGDQGNHNFGLAWDIALFDVGRYLTTAALYIEAAELNLADSFDWGGFVSPTHYQLARGRRLSAFGSDFEEGLTLDENLCTYPLGQNRGASNQ